MGQGLGKGYIITWWGSGGDGSFLFYIKKYDDSVSIAIMRAMFTVTNRLTYSPIHS
jgi:hypothetical protein